MWRTVCAGSWICLLTLAGTLLVSELKGASCPRRPRSSEKLYRLRALSSVAGPCCLEANRYIKFTIIQCVKQKPRKGCRSKNYAVRVQGGKWFCIRSDSKWMKRQIDTAKVNCYPGF